MMNLSSFRLPEIRTPRWAQGGHLQTLWAHYLPSEKIAETSEMLQLSTDDDDFLFCENFERPGNVIAVLLHGLSGDSSADYMQITGKALLECGVHTVLMNHRGAGPYWAQAKKPYHSGRAEDLSQVIGFLRQKYPGKKIVTIGFSMSGNVVALNATGFRSEHVADLSISLNAPIDLSVSSRHLQQGFNRIYDIRFVFRLRALIMKKAHMGAITLPHRIPRFCSIRDLDEIFTAPFSGFKDREDYYSTCSAIRYINQLKSPLWLITAQDDPFVQIDTYKPVIPRNDLRVSILPTGGHLGYLHETEHGVERWLRLWALELGHHLDQSFSATSDLNNSNSL